MTVCNMLHSMFSFHQGSTNSDNESELNPQSLPITSLFEPLLSPLDKLGTKGTPAILYSSTFSLPYPLQLLYVT